MDGPIPMDGRAGPGEKITENILVTVFYEVVKTYDGLGTVDLSGETRNDFCCLTINDLFYHIKGDAAVQCNEQSIALKARTDLFKDGLHIARTDAYKDDVSLRCERAVIADNGNVFCFFKLSLCPVGNKEITVRELS